MFIAWTLASPGDIEAAFPCLSNRLSARIAIEPDQALRGLVVLRRNMQAFQRQEQTRLWVCTNCIRYAHPAEAQTARCDEQDRTSIISHVLKVLEHYDVCISFVFKAVEKSNVRLFYFKGGRKLQRGYFIGFKGGR